MSLRINTNVASLMAQRNLQTVTGRLQETFGRLSSGLRINSAADDASGLGISMQMRAQMRSMTAAARNTQDGISLAQVAEGALHQMSDIFIRLKELGILALNGTYTQEDRETMDAEYLGLVDELQRIAEETQFNGLSLFTTGDDVEIQVGADDGDTISIGLSNLTQFPQFLAAFPLSGPIGPAIPVSLMDFMIDSISQVRGEFGAVINRLQSVHTSLVNQRGQLAGAESRIRDADLASETAQLTKDLILQQAATAVLSQANSSPQLALDLL